MFEQYGPVVQVVVRAGWMTLVPCYLESLNKWVIKLFRFTAAAKIRQSFYALCQISSTSFNISGSVKVAKVGMFV